MKHGRVTATSFAALSIRLAGIVVSLAGAFPAQGADVPFTELVISTAADGAVSVFAADVDGDGDTDVLSASRGDQKIAWYENDGGSPPAFTERVISNTAVDVLQVFATDLDRDGDTDVLSTSCSPGNIAWYESDGGSPPTFTERVIATECAPSVFTADVDGDGNTDVISLDFDNHQGEVLWYESDGGSPPTFTERIVSNNGRSPASVFATDVDGDGDTDILSAAVGNQPIDTNIAWFESNGGSPPTFTEHVISTNADAALAVFAADVDGDGDTDVLSTSHGPDKIAWYESDGGSPPTFTEHVLSTNAAGPRSVVTSDVDGDGDTDVLSASSQDDKIAWYENDGGRPPSFTERAISTTTGHAESVFATDVDGDGDIDVLSASGDDNKIAWYENLSPCGFDADCDGDVDLNDFGTFQAAFTGSK